MNRAAAHRSAARILGAALAVAACNPPRVLGAPVAGWALVLAAAGAAWWAAPMVDTRPVLSSMRWSAVAVQRRNTLLPAGAIVLAALTGPAVWLAGCVTGLLVAYLLVTDGWTMGATAPAGTDRATPRWPPPPLRPSSSPLPPRRSTTPHGHGCPRPSPSRPPPPAWRWPCGTAPERPPPAGVLRPARTVRGRAAAPGTPPVSVQ